VVPVGDAVHTMPPTGGVGANTALRDASTLSRALAEVNRGALTLADAIARYQAEMTEYAMAAVRMSLKVAKWSIQVEIEDTADH
jgi:2-polyprenyl-6-methoxyphenol hydroxylase-like FAD-dependent oxidoreductase